MCFANFDSIEFTVDPIAAMDAGERRGVPFKI